MSAQSLAARQAAWTALWRKLLTPLPDDAADPGSKNGSAPVDETRAEPDAGGARHAGGEPLD